MSGARHDPVRVLVDLLIDAGALFYTKPCWLDRQLHIYLHLVEITTSWPLQRIHYALDKIARECSCEFVSTNIDDGFAVYSVGQRARELEIRLGDVFMGFPEYRPTSSTALAPLGKAEESLRIPTRLDLPRHLQMPNPTTYRDVLNILVRLGEFMWEKKAALPTNFRRETEAVLQHDYRPLVTRTEQLVLRAIEFHREEEVELPSFLCRLPPDALEWDD